MTSVQPRIRPYDDRDAEAVVDLSLRAWTPVFASLERVLGPDISGRLHPDWREDQRRAVEDVCAAKKGRVWVAELDGAVVGFAATEVYDPERRMGEISMLAVDPDHAPARRTYEKAGYVLLPIARYFKNL